MMRARKQSGVALVVSLVMLVVLTLLVVSAIRFGNINLKISGNVQAQTESAAAAQVAIEKVVQSATGGANLSAMVATTTPVSTGGKTYNVAVAKPSCIITKNVDMTTLNPNNANDRPCFGQSDSDKLVTSSGTLTSTPSACKDQSWNVAAQVGDGESGNNMKMVQGVSMRVGAEVSCP